MYSWKLGRLAGDWLTSVGRGVPGGKRARTTEYPLRAAIVPMAVPKLPLPNTQTFCGGGTAEDIAMAVAGVSLNGWRCCERRKYGFSVRLGSLRDGVAVEKRRHR